MRGAQSGQPTVPLTHHAAVCSLWCGLILRAGHTAPRSAQRPVLSVPSGLHFSNAICRATWCTLVLVVARGEVMVMTSPPPVRRRTRLPDICGQRPRESVGVGAEHTMYDPFTRGHSKLYQRRWEIEAELRRELNLERDDRPTLLQHVVGAGRLGPHAFGRPPPVPKPRARTQRLPAIPKPAEPEAASRRRWGSMDDVDLQRQSMGAVGAEAHATPEPTPVAPPNATESLTSAADAVAAAAFAAAARAAARPCDNIPAVPTAAHRNGGGSSSSSRVPSPALERMRNGKEPPLVTPPMHLPGTPPSPVDAKANVPQPQQRPQSWRRHRRASSSGREMQNDAVDDGEARHDDAPELHRETTNAEESKPSSQRRGRRTAASHPARGIEHGSVGERDDKEEPWRIKAKELEEIAREHRRRNEEAARRHKAAAQEREASEAEAAQTAQEERERRRSASEDLVREQQRLEERRFEEIRLQEERRREREVAEAASRWREQEHWEREVRQRFADEARRRRVAQRQEMEQEERRQELMREEALKEQEQREEQRRLLRERDERERERRRAERRVKEEQRYRENAEEARRASERSADEDRQWREKDEFEPRGLRHGRPQAPQPPPPPSGFRVVPPRPGGCESGQARGRRGSWMGSWGQGASPPCAPAHPPPPGTSAPSPPRGQFSGPSGVGGRPAGCSTPSPGRTAGGGASTAGGCSGARPSPLPSAASSPQAAAQQDDALSQAQAAARRQLDALREMPSRDARQKGFKELLRAWHPDKNPQSVEVATAVFQRIQAERAQILG